MAITYRENITRYSPGVPQGADPMMKCVERYKGEVAFVGEVYGTTSRCERIMIDEWTTGYYALVATPTGTVEVYLGNYDFGCHADAEVDCPPALKAAALAADEAKAVAKAADEAALALKNAQERAKEELLSSIERGTRVRVVKGRKVPRGTVGVCIWLGGGGYGERIGIKDDAGEVHWTALSNVERADATELAILANGDWVTLRNERANAEYAAREAARAAAPRKGAKVTTACGHTGEVFWIADDGSRLGVRVGPNRNDVVWAAVNTVAAA